MKQRFDLHRILLGIAKILVRLLDLVEGHAPFHPAQQGVLLVLGEIGAGLVTQQDTELFQHVLGLGGRGEDHAGFFAESVGHIGDQPGWHFGRRQNIVHQAGRDGAARHAVVLGGVGGLRDDHAALALDRSYPQRAVAAGAREHDADGPLVLILGQGSEEKVDGHPQTARRVWLQQLQATVQKGHVAVGRNDVSAVGLDLHTVLNLIDLHAGIAFDQVAQDALVVRGQVLHQDEGHVDLAVGGHGGKKGLERRQPTGRGAHADNGKGLFRLGRRARFGHFSRRFLNRRFRRNRRLVGW